MNSSAQETEAEPEDQARESDGVPRTLDRRARAQIQTARIERHLRASWPAAIATLEQISGWAVLALRLGTLALIQQCVRELAEEKADVDLIVRLRSLTDALAHMPLETRPA